MPLKLFSKRLQTRKSITVLVTFITALAIAAILVQILKGIFLSSNVAPASVKELVDVNLNEGFLEPITAVPQLTVIDADLSALPAVERVDTDVIEKQESEIDSKLLDVLEKIQHNQQQNNDALLYFDERLKALENLEPKIQSAIDSQNNSIKKIDQILWKLETKLDETIRTAEQPPELKIESHLSLPPFRLIAIDRWQNQWNAILELDGRITMIEPNSSRAGWKLLNIDPSKQSALFRAKSGKQMELQVDG